MRRPLIGLLGLATAGLFCWVMERPRCKFVMTTFDHGVSRAE